MIYQGKKSIPLTSRERFIVDDYIAKHQGKMPKHKSLKGLLKKIRLAYDKGDVV